MRFLFLLLLVSLLSACSNVQARIDLLEEELSIELPEEFGVMQDDDISHNGFESDYTLIVKLKLEPEGTTDILTQIREVPYFNQLERYYNDGTGIHLMNEEIEIHKKVEDSISRTDYRASWFRDHNGYRLVDFGNPLEPIDAFLDTVENTLLFEYNSL